MHDLFAPMPEGLRRQRLIEYERYLADRDGELNVAERTLSKREASTQRFEDSSNVLGSMDPAEFRAHYASFDRSKPPSEGSHY